MTRILCWLTFAIFSGAAIAAPVTYDFTGVVGQGKGIYSSIVPGTSITGTYTIDYGNAITSQSQGVVGDPIYSWVAEEHGGAAYDLPVEQAFVFESTAEVDGFSYATGPPGTWISRSYVAGSPGDVATYETNLSYNNSNDIYGTDSSFVIQNSNPTYKSGYLPMLSGAYAAGGYFEVVGQGQVSYQITSLTVAPVPLPPASWLLLSGLAGLGKVARRNRSVAR